MIESYKFGKIVIDGKTYSSDLIIYEDKIEDNWWRQKGHSLSPDDIQKVIDAQPDLLIVGTGYSGLMKVPRKTKKFIEEKGIQLIAEKTPNAVKTYNGLSKTDEQVIAALHLTC